MKLNYFFIIFALASTSFFTYAEEAKKEETKKEETKKEETKKEETKKEETKKEEPKKEEAKKEAPKKEETKRPKECFYKAHSLAVVEFNKFEDEVKKIKDNFEKCESMLLQEKEREAKQAECKKMREDFKTKRSAFNKLVFSSKTSNKDDFEKAVLLIKLAKEDLLKDEANLNGLCPKKKEEPKKEEPKKEEPKKEEPKKEEPKKEEPKKEEPKKE